ncbi:MAG: hypothetical protein JSS02_02940, partial [Planctomycetes bacterium]|nr:hypothetical protein [Planctomycetota bacterium]
DEVNQLPEKLRLPFVLFHLENRSLAEVAELTRSTVPTVGTWLQRSREKLAGRLRKRGIVLGAASLGALLSRQATAEVVPDAFVSATVQMTSAAGVAACTPAVASLVLAGAPGGVSKLVWIVSSLAVTVIGFPLTFIWLLPELQTRQSPDFPLLQGEWREVAHEQNGGPLHAQNPVPYVGVLHITGRNYRFLQTLPDGRVLEGNHGSFVLDGSPAPSTIDFRQWQGTVYGRYDLDGDTLMICVTRHGGPRPDKLSTTSNDDRILTRYERSK